MLNPRRIFLSGDALKHNLAQVRRHASDAKVLAMIKDNAYGHGLLWVAQNLVAAGVDALAVACLEEGVRLRQAAITIPILLMSEWVTLERLREAQHYGLGVVLHDLEQLPLLKTLQNERPLWLWIKVNTGMHRLGIAPDQLPLAWHEVCHLPQIQKPIGILTHFASAEDLVSPMGRRQIEQFTHACSLLPLNAAYFKSLANSAAFFAYPEIQEDWVRPGLMLYGATPFEHKSAADLGLKPVMTVKSKVIAVYDVPAGGAVGYGGIFVCPRNSRIAVVAFGYGDGYPRQAQNSLVLINNAMLPMVGRVSMDMLTVDVTGQAVQVGDDVTLWGEGLPVELLAKAANTIPYEIFCRMPTHRMETIAT